MPPLSDQPIDTSRPICRNLEAQRKRYAEDHARWLRRLRETRDPDERDRIMETLERLEYQIQDVEYQLTEAGCYLPEEVPHSVTIKIEGMEVTQAIQFYRQLGSGGTPNSVPLVANKATLCRVYVQNGYHQDLRFTGRILVMAWNNNTLKYDILRRELTPRNERSLIVLPATATSDRRRLANTLNFVLDASHCNERLQLDAEVWVEGHRGDPSYTGKGGCELLFNTRERPVIHCYRYSLTGFSPTIAEPTDAACRTTMELAPRILPIEGLTIRDRGVRTFGGALDTNNKYDQMRIEVQGLRDGTTPTPLDHEIFVAMVPAHTQASGVTAAGAALSNSFWCLADREDTFAHELAHLIIPGDDHVLDAACTTPENVDTNYPDYPNTTRPSGIGEFGVDLGTSPMEIFGPDTSDLMSYCRPRWISPYNYARAFSSPMLNPYDRLLVRAGEAQKLLVRFTVEREGTATLLWAFHLPGEAPRRVDKYETPLSLQLYRADGDLLVARRCHPASDASILDPYADFLETLPWTDDVTRIVLTRNGEVIASWDVAEVPSEPIARDLSATPVVRRDVESGLRISWKRARRRSETHQMLRYSPDGGATWIPYAIDIEGDEVEIPLDLLRGAGDLRFQLATSTGIRTTFIETSVPRLGSEAVRVVEILAPAADAVLSTRQPVRLIGRTEMWLDGRSDDPHAYWTSNRDGFLADGLQAEIDGLSRGRHVLRLVVDDGTSETSDRVIVSVGDD
ncbi:hypothetical protein G5V57_33700 [Nordella sp. HKS 07]|uniref:hypothetical protein n=1 Tax=Nordella sp. HKS 07 TaxID=2712222 RepID=UPI0013E19769|nr:hypothetical protein [Nordella sp. HKS 07]QIG52222.1 hypothetical protein G5V57_33700 [Nordella sp. HKS 07]